MAKFLDTTAVSDHLTQLIKRAEEKIILISPYLKINDRIRDFLEDRDRFKIDIRLIYGKEELRPSEIKWLETLSSVRTSFSKNLHAKCYINESEAIITSMNLYEFSQVNNEEMGISISATDDPDLYQEVLEEAKRLIRNSDEVKLSVKKVDTAGPTKKAKPGKSKGATGKGVCIRCGKSIALDPTHPYCNNCFKVWKKYSDDKYKEKHCHICGKDNASTLVKPTCYPCYNSHKTKLVFPTSS